MEKRLFGLRGATGAEDTAESIRGNVAAMCLSLFRENGLVPGDIVSVQFTVTGDLTAMNPAAALRTGQQEFDVSQCALFCGQEPAIAGAPGHFVRVLVTAYLPEGSTPRHVFVNGAEKLRPDLTKRP